jgi:hypothetical protein
MGEEYRGTRDELAVAYDRGMLYGGKCAVDQRFADVGNSKDIILGVYLIIFGLSEYPELQY